MGGGQIVLKTFRVSLSLTTNYQMSLILASSISLESTGTGTFKAF
jgi:hypothetical protein